MANVLQRPSLDPGQKIKGTIYFPTEVNGGSAKQYVLTYKAAKVTLGSRQTPKADQLMSSNPVSECDLP
jgi:hypothetical protein